MKRPKTPYAVVHYSRGEFKYPEKDEIFGLHVYYGGNFISFTADNPIEEIKAIQDYSKMIREIRDAGGIIYHFNQSSNIFGPDHICTRYTALTGLKLDLDYGKDCVNIGHELVKMHGDTYVPHPRLDNLARLNKWPGATTDESSPIFDHTRTSLIVKVLYAAWNGTLKIQSDADREAIFNRDMIHKIKAELKNEPSQEKLLTRSEAMELLDVCSSTMLSWTNQKKLPFTRIGKRLYFLRSEILKSNSNQ